jgi:hypothetical protein
MPTCDRYVPAAWTAQYFHAPGRYALYFSRTTCNAWCSTTAYARTLHACSIRALQTKRNILDLGDTYVHHTEDDAATFLLSYLPGQYIHTFRGAVMCVKVYYTLDHTCNTCGKDKRNIFAWNYVMYTRTHTDDTATFHAIQPGHKYVHIRVCVQHTWISTWCMRSCKCTWNIHKETIRCSSYVT